MLDQILELVKQHGREVVVNNPEIPNEYNNQVLSETAHSITQNLQSEVSSGGLQNVLSLFSQGQNRNSLLNNPMVAAMVSQLAGNLISRMNLNPQLANNVSTHIVPSIISSLTNRTISTQPQDSSFNINSLINALTGGHSGGGSIDFQQLLHQFTQGEQAAVDPQIAQQLASQAQHHQQQGGGIRDLIQGFFK